ncbi:protein of unknown function [Nocardia cyriacigeorgica GUH-2]|uniref:Uncharacterized protein n=1 Tax=Nocardia cyriacigeorgica (strain GUH-2) TaxID=1127134 RepID=H6R6I6_NOCCG|nr:protein of unknown function [Nocardia cyriacigeorgica GUH-2]
MNRRRRARTIQTISHECECTLGQVRAITRRSEVVAHVERIPGTRAAARIEQSVLTTALTDRIRSPARSPACPSGGVPSAAGRTTAEPPGESAEAPRRDGSADSSGQSRTKGSFPSTGAHPSVLDPIGNPPSGSRPEHAADTRQHRIAHRAEHNRRRYGRNGLEDRSPIHSITPSQIGERA